MGLPKRKTDLSQWQAFVEKSKNGTKEVTIAVVGKYFDSGDFVLSDVYISVLEALKTAAYQQRPQTKNHATLTQKILSRERCHFQTLDAYDGVLIPGGFGETGVEGKIKVIEYVRKNKIPYFGLCYGMQLMVIEYARNVAGLAGANTAEIDPNAPHTVIDVHARPEG